MSKCKKCLLSFFCTLICLFNMLPLSAFAVSRTLTFNCPEPAYGSNNNYIALGFNSDYGRVLCFNAYPISRENEKIPLDITVTLQSLEYNSSTKKMDLSFVVASNALTDYFLNFYIIHSNGTVTYQPIYVIENALYQGVYSWTASSSSDELYGLTFKGNVMIDGDYFPNVPQLNPIWSDNNQYFSQLQSIIDNLITLHSDNIDLVNKFVEAINNLSTLHSDNVEQLGKLVEIINLLVQNNADNVQMLEKLSDILSDTSSIETITSNLLYTLKLYFPQYLDILYYIDDELLTCIDKLNKIIDLLQPDTEVNVSKVDPSNFNEYNKAEQSLIDNSNIDVSGALNVEIDQNALLFIWPLVEDCLNTHPQIIGLVFTILSISIVALVLGRKGG